MRFKEEAFLELTSLSSGNIKKKKITLVLGV
jgi:hypothetical protein